MSRLLATVEQEPEVGLIGLNPLISVDPSLNVTATRIEETSFISSSVKIDVGESGGVSKGL